VLERRVQKPTTDAGALQPGLDGEQGQEPQPAPPQPQPDADQLVVQLGHHRAAGVGAGQVPDAGATPGDAGRIVRTHREAVLLARVVQ